MKRTSLKRMAFIALFFLVFSLLHIKSIAAVEVIPTGSKIINMGVTPQTIANGLKPYGLVYALLKANVPVQWVISSAKVKDGVDFSHNGVDYKSSAFIISANYLTTNINSIITTWVGKGVVVNTSVSSFSVDVTQTLKSAPFWVMDAQNGRIAVTFLTNAEIPATAYIFKEPSQLTICDDIYVMPHADPTWATHKNLWYWNRDYKGNIWAGCHAVSVLENCFGPDITTPAITRRMNFLMSDGPSAGQNALPFNNHGNGTPPFISQYPTHPVMQFMGKTDDAHNNGSEKIFMPWKPGGSWRPSTYIGVYDPSQGDVPSKSDGPAATVVFGRAFGDANRGYVLYEGGHKINNTPSADAVAAQRVFFNASFFYVLDKQISSTVSGVPTVLNAGQTYTNLTVTTTSPLPGTTLYYQWISTCGGTFSNPNGTTTSFTAPSVGSTTNCIVTCKVTDNCGRVVFDSKPISVITGPRSPVCVADVATVPACSGNTASINVLSNDSNPDGGALTVTLLSSGSNGTFTNTGNGIITYVPNSGFSSGSDVVTYQVCNATGQCCTSTITVSISLNDNNGCSPIQYYGVTSDITASTATMLGGSAPAGLTSSYGDADGIAADATTYANFNNTAMIARYTLSSALPAAGNISFFVDGTSGRQFTVSESVDGTTWTNPITFTVTATDDFLDAFKKTYAASAGTAYIRVAIVSQPVLIDAMVYDVYGCMSASPNALPDYARTLEDMPVTIDVLSNDDDPLGNELVPIAIAEQPRNGKVSINTDGTITYLNTKDQIGTGIDTFSYKIRNTKGLISIGYVYVTIVEDACPANQYKPYTATVSAITLNAIADNYLRQSSPTTNYGGNTQLKLKGKSTSLERPILKFDLTTIGTTALIDSASLSLYQQDKANTENVSVYRLTRAFNETGSTWNNADATPTAWTTAGGDFSSTIWATTNIGNTNNVYKNWNVRSLVQAFVNTTFTNNGFLLARNPEGGSGKFKEMKFGSRTGTAGQTPKLYIRYRVPSTCVAIPSYAPLAMPDTATTNAVTAITINVIANDFDYNSTGLTVSLSRTTSRKGGTLSISSNQVVYTPPTSPYYNGVDTFSYIVTSSSLVDSAKVYVDIANAGPTAVRDDYTIQSNTISLPSSLTATVTTNDIDPEGSGFSTPTFVLYPKNGVATFSPQLTYTPNTNFVGNDTLIYLIYEASSTSCTLLSDTAIVIITVTNRAPTGVTDNVTINGCEIKTIQVTSNDTDPEGDKMTVQIVTNPSLGSVALSNNNTEIIYTPPTSTTGTTTSFTYKVCDNATPSLCSGNVTVNITIRATPAANTAPVAVRDTFKTNMNVVLYADVMTNDSDPDGNFLKVPVSILINPTHGTAAGLTSGLVAYTPTVGYFGLDSFYYQVTDSIGTVSGCTAFGPLTASAWVYIIVQDFPIANRDYLTVAKNTAGTISVITNDIFGMDGPASGTIVVVTPPVNGNVSVLANSNANQSDDQLRYIPNINYSGIDSLIYQICDTNGDCDTAIVYILVKPDTDNDGVPDDIDIDDDNDGITDVIEVCGNGATSFSCLSGGNDPSGDVDQDGIVNGKDADFGMLNVAGCVAVLDTDGDGIADYLDLDSENDGIPDVVEAGGADFDGDGIIDNYYDSDYDGLSQNVDANETGETGSGSGLGFQDFDGDGIPNSTDPDSDSDGVPDIIEAGGTDTNNDGKTDSFTDTDLDGLANAYDPDEGNDGYFENIGVPILLTGDDLDGNGRPESYPNKNIDQMGKPNPYDLDADGDGITDAVEAGFANTVSVSNGMVSGAATAGWANTVRALASLNLVNTDGRANPNYLDVDSDDDGISDNVEGQPTYSYSQPSDADSDNDGINDAYEVSSGTFGGGGITPYDHDADGYPDFTDTDTDNDGAPDINESSLQFSLTQANINTSDTDGDGMLDEFDNVSVSGSASGTKYKNVTNSNMGSGGSFNGPIPSGSNVSLVKSQVTGGDRDWRNLSILPLQIVNFGASFHNATATLTWKVENEKQVEQYTIERSDDGNIFDPLSKVRALNNNTGTYTYNDNLTFYKHTMVYYRILQSNLSGARFYTRVVSFNLKGKPGLLQIYPNPVVSELTVLIQSTTKELATMFIYDAGGKKMYEQGIVLQKGNNVFNVSEVRLFSKGFYTITVRTTDKILVNKFTRQ